MRPTETQHTWAICAEALPVVARYARGELAEQEARAEIEPPERQLSVATQGQVAIIPLQGVITPRGSLLSALTGGAGGLQSFREALYDAVASDDVGSILIPINSPGGRSALVAETAAEVAAAATKKKVVAVASTMACSAAYWIGSQAGEFVVSPSGEVGSIGVFLVHEDWSGYDERLGIKTTLISEGKHKTAGNMFEPLSDEARTVLQESVREVYDQFVADVAGGRSATEAAVRNGYGEGAVVGAQRAVDLGLADRIESFEDAVDRLVSETRGGLRAAAATESLAGNDGDDKKELLTQMQQQLEETTKSLKEG